MDYDAIYAELKKDRRKKSGDVTVPHRDVARRYDGGEHSTQTAVRQAVSVAHRLTHETIEAIGTVVNMECADVIVKTPDLNYHSFTSKDEVLTHQDCRLFKKFVCFGSLRAAKAFMSAIADGKELAQVNTIFRMRHWSELHRYRSVQSKVVSEQFMLAALALKEEEKFLRIIGETEWPEHMETARENVLRTTMCDEELRSNDGNDDDVLPAIWSCFKRLYPAKAKAIQETLDGPSKPYEQSEETLSSAPIPEPHCDSREEDSLAKETEKVEDTNVSMREKSDKILRQQGILSYRMTVQEFEFQHWKSTSSRVDLVLSSLPPDCDIDKLRLLPSHCEQFLNPGSYIFLIVNEQQFSVLQQEFKSRSFKVMDTSFKILYKIEGFGRRTTVDFPQRIGDIAFIAKTPGNHPQNFIPSFCESDNGTSDHFACVLNVPSCKNKLKRPNENSSLFPGEKSVELFEYVMKLFSPAGGSVIDPFANTFTSGIAALRVGRQCICIEHNQILYSYGIGRLRIYSTPDATMAQLCHYSEPIDLDSLHVPIDRNDSNEQNEKKEQDQAIRSPKKRKLGDNVSGQTRTNDHNASLDEEASSGAEALLLIRSRQ